MLRYKNFKLIKPDKDQIDKIEETIENNGSIFHDYYLNEIIRKEFNTQLYYLVDDLVNINRLCPVHVTKTKYGGKKYHLKPLYDIPYAGFVGNEVFDINKLSINFFESINYIGFPYNKKSQTNESLDSGETTMVDLSIDENDIFSNVIHSKRRNMIRKAEKSFITVNKYNCLDGFKLFWPILKELHDKLGYNHLKYDYYKKIIKHYSETNQLFTLIAFKDEVPISGILIMGNKNYMHYYKGASLFNVKNEGQGELLQWEAIKLSKSLGIKYYDLCNLNKKDLPAIYRFKTGISSNIYNYQKYSKINLGYKILNKLDNV